MNTTEDYILFMNNLTYLRLGSHLKSEDDLYALEIKPIT